MIKETNIKFTNIVITLSLILFTSSCTTIVRLMGYWEYFYLNTSQIDKEDIPCYNMTGYGTVEADKEIDNAIHINEGGMVSIISGQATQYVLDMTFELKSGKGFEIHLRNERINFDPDKAIRLEFTDNKCRIFDREKLVGQKPALIELNKQYRIIIKNEGNKLKVSFDCADIMEYRTELTASEHTIIGSIDKSKLFISGIELKDIREKKELVDDF